MVYCVKSLGEALFDMGTLDVTCVRFDVSGAALLRVGDSVRVVSRLMMSDDTGEVFHCNNCVLMDRWL